MNFLANIGTNLPGFLKTAAQPLLSGAQFLAGKLFPEPKPFEFRVGEGLAPEQQLAAQQAISGRSRVQIPLAPEFTPGFDPSSGIPKNVRPITLPPTPAPPVPPQEETPPSTGGPVQPAPQAPSGTTGLSATGGGGGFVQQAGTGAAGLAGGSAFRGALGAAGGLGTPSVLGGQAEQKRRREQEQITQIQQAFPGARIQKNFQTGELFAVQDGRIVTTKEISETPGFQPFSSPQEPFAVPPPQGEIDIARMAADRATQAFVERLRGSGTPLTQQEMQKFFQDTFAAEKARITAENPVPEEMVVDTQEQVNFLANVPQEQQFGMRQQMDAARQKSGLPGLESQQVDLMRQAQAIVNTYEKIAKDIRENPNLPVGLARRRLQQVEDEFGVSLRNIQGQLGIVRQQIADANEVVNREFNISKLESDERKSQRDDARQILQQYISTSAIANFNDAQLQQIAGAGLGYDLVALKQLRNAVKTNNQQKMLEAQTKLDQSQQRIELYAQSIQNTVEKAGLANQINQLKIQQLLQGAATDESGNPIILPQKAKDQLLKLDSVQTIADQVKQMILDLGPEVFGPAARVKGFFQKTKEFFALAPAVRSYETFRKASIGPLARAISGEVGVLTDRDIARAEGLLPKVGESQEEVNLKLKNLYTTLEQARSNVLKQYGAQNATVQPTQADMNYILSLGL